MALDDLFFFDSKNQVLGLSVTTKESHVLELAVSQNPMMGTIPISDHAYLRLRIVRLNVFISNYPMWTSSLFSLDGLFYDIGSWSNFYGNLASNIGSNVERTLGLPNTFSPSRARTAFEKIQKLMAQPRPLKVQTNLYLYSNMVIARFTPTTDVGNVQTLQGEMELREVLLTNQQGDRFKNVDDNMKNTTAQTQDKGDTEFQSAPPSFNNRATR